MNLPSDPEPQAHPLRIFAQDLVTIGPRGGAHRVALRAGVSVLVPLMILVLVGRTEWTAYAAFGAFTALYGRHHVRSERAGMQVVAGCFLVLSVGLGVLLSAAPDARWLVVVVGALLAAAGSLASDAYRWHPPGPLFMIFGFAVCAIGHPGIDTLPIAVGIAAASAAFSLVVSHVGVVRDPDGLRRPALPSPQVRVALGRPGVYAHLIRYVIACSIAGAIATGLGWAHPYWAMVAAVVVLAGPDFRSRITRGTHRVIGTLLGAVIAAVILSFHPQGVAAVLVIVVLQVVTELFVGRNYALALLFITPLALMMGQLVHPTPVAQLLRDRLLETLLGAAIAMVVLVIVPDRLRRAPAPAAA
ncbi:FUSC family protein [Allobranchiibius sp. CTAmp26]|uniref:FUSC family protein n=1 Tax=Allobranchiibius sp. CTAmp26 TaxID=2815214 RepID=UPI001AA1BDD8|nr:FUSC family protein [Allobranchiibius sp. CTAmp26]MBO1756629.1 FUSC family protein [Allobranchiibius sp. CTAmp26]